MMKLSLLIKQVLSHPRDRLACKTRDMYDDMETVDYNPPEDVELSDAETVQYNIENFETLQALLIAQKAQSILLQKNKIRKKYCRVRTKTKV